jgi:hypothetical protein
LEGEIATAVLLAVFPAIEEMSLHGEQEVSHGQRVAGVLDF